VGAGPAGADLAAIRDWGATTLVTLIEDHEFDLLKVPALGRARVLKPAIATPRAFPGGSIIVPP
jgi:hypothetical protein